MVLRDALTLEQSFGGMGSLNDIYICAENRNVPPDRAAAPRAARFLWRVCEWSYRGEPAPRILKAFAPRRRSR